MAELKTTSETRAAMRKYITEMVEADSGWSDQNRDQGFLLDDVENLKRDLAEAQKNTWQDITPENLPRKGDEVGYWSKSGEFVVCSIWNSRNLTYKQWKYGGWKYLHPINPPVQEPKP